MPTVAGLRGLPPRLSRALAAVLLAVDAQLRGGAAASASFEQVIQD